MNHKQKLGYTVLGAVIMLVGIGVGAIVTPSLVAQHNGVFDEIKCSKLTVLDKAGKPVAVLGITEEDGNAIVIFNPEGKKGVRLSASKGGSSLRINNPSGESALSILSTDVLTWLHMAHSDEHTGIALRVFNGISSSIEVNTPTGKKGLELRGTDRVPNILSIYDKAESTAIYASGNDRSIHIKDEEGGLAITLNSDSVIGNSVSVYEREGDIAGQLEWEKLAGKRFNVKDKLGKIKWTAP